MKTLYFDLYMGAAGDMLTAALFELLPDPDAVLSALNAVGLPGVRYVAETSKKCGITGTHMCVLVDGAEETEAPEDGYPHDPHGHSHEHEQSYAHGHSHEHEQSYAHEHSHEHTHEHTHRRHHAHEHEHAHDHEHMHTHDHEHAHHHAHTHLSDIEKTVEGLNLSEKVKRDVLAVYRLLAEAESHVHGEAVPNVHFHEVGSMDALADVTAVCLLMDRLSPDTVAASPVHVGSGTVHCAHGVLPVPAPATAFLLRGIPACGGDVEGELCTPTGAALLKYFVNSFGPRPAMAASAVGYGMGKKDFPAANCVRATIGEAVPAGTDEEERETLYLLSCNLDDMTPEEIAFAFERLFEAGAREVYTVPVGMKKGRTGTLLRVLCDKEKKAGLLKCLFLHTATLGVREQTVRRHTLRRSTVSQETPFGPMRKKIAEGYGVNKEKWEYEDLARVSRETGLSLAEIRRKLSEI
ncbi:MAG: nickel pincer cofactor biosynthesis protein LarC [Clostridia bacterium]|nr:nickel pincer cofactor biosynthesis protein LarC [Clostridia bacterium]